VSGDGRVYRRPLPGGGYVAIDSTPEPSTDKSSDKPNDKSTDQSAGAPKDGKPAIVRAQVLVERRSDPGRRVGHVPPVVAETVAEDVEHAIDELRKIAADNVAVARALQRWQARRSDGGAAATTPPSGASRPARE